MMSKDVLDGSQPKAGHSCMGAVRVTQSNKLTRSLLLLFSLLGDSPRESAAVVQDGFQT